MMFRIQYLLTATEYQAGLIDRHTLMRRLRTLGYHGACLAAELHYQEEERIACLQQKALSYAIQGEHR